MNPAQRISALAGGEVIKYRESGNSMVGIISHRELITCAPINDYSTLKKGDVVFCKVHGRYYTHLVKATKQSLDRNGECHYRFLIGNNRGGTNGWTDQSHVFGKVIAVGKE